MLQPTKESYIILRFKQFGEDPQVGGMVMCPHTYGHIACDTIHIDSSEEKKKFRVNTS